MMRVSPGDGDDGVRLHPVFRVLAWVLGPTAIMMGLLTSVASVYVLLTGGWDAWRDGFWAFAACFGAIPIGILLLRAARTGRDPYTPARPPR